MLGVEKRGQHARLSGSNAGGSVLEVKKQRFGMCPQTSLLLPSAEIGGLEWEQLWAYGRQTSFVQQIYILYSLNGRHYSRQGLPRWRSW